MTFEVYLPSLNLVRSDRILRYGAEVIDEEEKMMKAPKPLDQPATGPCTTELRASRLERLDFEEVTVQ